LIAVPAECRFPRGLRTVASARSRCKRSVWLFGPADRIHRIYRMPSSHRFPSHLLPLHPVILTSCLLPPRRQDSQDLQDVLQPPLPFPPSPTSSFHPDILSSFSPRTGFTGSTGCPSATASLPTFSHFILSSCLLSPRRQDSQDLQDVLQPPLPFPTFSHFIPSS